MGFGVLRKSLLPYCLPFLILLELFGPFSSHRAYASAASLFQSFRTWSKGM